MLASIVLYVTASEHSVESMIYSYIVVNSTRRIWNIVAESCQLFSVIVCSTWASNLNMDHVHKIFLSGTNNNGAVPHHSLKWARSMLSDPFVWVIHQLNHVPYNLYYYYFLMNYLNNIVMEDTLNQMIPFCILVLSNLWKYFVYFILRMGLVR